MTDHVIATWHDDTLPRVEVELLAERPQVVLAKNGRPKATGETLPAEIRIGIFPRGRIATSNPTRLRRLAVLFNQAADRLSCELGDTSDPHLFACHECGADLDNEDHDPDCPDQYLEPATIDVPTGTYL